MDQNEAPSNNTNKNSDIQHPAENTNTAAPTLLPSSTLQPPTKTPPPATSTTTMTVPTSTTAAAPEIAPPSTATATAEPTVSSATSSVPVTMSTVPTTTTTTTTTSPTPTPPPPAPATTPAAPTAPTTTAPSNDAPAAAVAAPSRRDEYWCHQCQAEITPMMVPDPMCPTCYSEFVEKIEADNDPRAFAPPARAVPAHLTGGSNRSEDGRHPEGEGRNNQGPVSLEDLFQLFQAFYTPHRSEAQQQQQRQRQQEIDQRQQRNQNHQQQQQHTPGQFFTTGTQYIFTTGPSGTTRTVTPLGSSGPIPAHGSQQPTGGHTLGGNPSGATPTTEGGTAGEGQHAQLGPQWHSPPSLISGLLRRLGIEIHYTTDPAALSEGFGGPMGFGGGFLPMAGNPGDYAWGQRGLDDIITQMMELQNRQHGPVGATDDIINAIPRHTLTDEELEAKIECSVCKDEFAKEDNSLQLPCKHIFHEDCIKPWLKVSGTCPTCRFSLVGGQDGQHAGDHTPPPHGGQDNNNGSGNNAPPGGNSNSSTGARPGGGGGGGFFGFGSAPPASSGTSIPGSFPANNNNATTGNGDAQTLSLGAQNTDHNLPMEPLD